MSDERNLVLSNMVKSIQDKNIHDNEVFQYTQSIRKTVLEEMLSKGDLSDFEQQRTILTALKDMDKQQVDKSRLQIDEKNSASNELVMEIVANMSKRFPRGMAIESTVGGVIPAIDDSALEGIEVPDLEKQQGIVQTTSKEFMDEFSKE